MQPILHRQHQPSSALDCTLASEVPVALVFNGISHAVMMASPGEAAELALGFALTEGILDSADDCYDIEVQTISAAQAGMPPGIDGVQVQMQMAARCFVRLKDRRRSLSGRTGCGVCGVDSFAALDLDCPALPAQDWLAQIDVHAVLYVERDSQKGIVIGKGGARLKEVGTAARTQIEKLLGTKVYLDLHVKVLKEWQRDPKMLGRLGF